MASKASDRLAEIRARVARRAAPEEPTPREEDAADTADSSALAAASAHFLGIAEQITHNKQVEQLPIGSIAPDPRPEMRQPRLLPLPEELVVRDEPVPAYRELVAELLTLGQSLHERQIQPIIVYPGTIDEDPTVRYFILVGHRRWTAARLSGIDHLDAIVVEPPTSTDRVRVQYAENEAREEFSDMERAWALTQMKQALGGAPWEDVEAQFSISRTRRHELTRLLAFTPPQQRQIALLRLQETQIRSLHSAVRANELAPAQVDQILARLEEIAGARYYASAVGAANAESARPSPRRVGIDGPTVARLVVRARRAVAAIPKQPAPRWLPPLRDQLANVIRGIQRAHDRISALDDADVAVLLGDAERLSTQLTGFVEALRQHHDEAEL